MYSFCLDSYCHVGERIIISFWGVGGFLGLITTYINEQVNRPSFLMTTFFLLSMGECVLEAESGSMRGEFLCATAADIFFSMTKSGMEEGQPLGYVTRKYTESNYHSPIIIIINYLDYTSFN